MLPLFNSPWQKLAVSRNTRCILLLFSVVIIAATFYLFVNSLTSPSCVCELPVADKNGITTLSFLPHSRILLSGNTNGEVDAWDIPMKSRSHLFKSYSPMRITANPNGDVFATTWLANRVACRSFSRHSDMQVYPGSPGAIESMSFSPSGNLLAAGGLDAIVIIWKVPSGQLVTTLRGHTHSVNALDFYEDRLLVTAASSRDYIRVWDLDCKKMTRELECPLSNIAALFFVNKSILIAFGSGSPQTDKSVHGEICFLNLSDAKSNMAIKVHSSISSAILTPDKDRFIAGCADGMLLIGNIYERQITHRIRAHKGNIGALSISSDGQLLASSSDDISRSGVIRIWDVKSLCSIGH